MLINLCGARIPHLKRLPRQSLARRPDGDCVGDSSQSKAVKVSLERWREAQRQSRIGRSNRSGVISRSCSNISFCEKKMDGAAALRNRPLSLWALVEERESMSSDEIGNDMERLAICTLPLFSIATSFPA